MIKDDMFNKLKGMDTVMRNLNKEITRIKGISMEGLLDVAAFIRKDMELTPPLIPIDTGNLRASWFVQPLRFPGKAVVLMGFNANYAIYVHERTEGMVNWGRPGSGPKFLEAAMKRNVVTILMLIKRKVHTK